MPERPNTRIPDEQLSAYVDGDLAPDERAEVEAALARSPELSERRRELETIRSLAGQLTEASPSRDLWPGIRQAVFRPPWWVRARDAAHSWLTGRGPLQVGLGLAAGVALVWGLNLGPTERAPVELAGAPTSVRAARASYRAAIAELAARAETRAEQLTPEARAALEHSLAVVDEAIARAEQALSGAPGDALAHRMVLDLYDQKLRVLQAAIDWTEEREG